MGDVTTESLNTVLRNAGIDPRVSTIESCTPDDWCQDVVTTIKGERKKFKVSIGEWFDSINSLIEFTPKSAARRYANVGRLFAPFGRQWAAVDEDTTEGAETVLYRDQAGWYRLEANQQLDQIEAPQRAYLLQLARKILIRPEDRDQAVEMLRSQQTVETLLGFLGEKNREQFLSQISFADFEKESYVFRASDPGDHSGKNPWAGKNPWDILHPSVTLAGHPEIPIPWSEPYLILEWESYLERLGVEVSVANQKDGTASHSFTWNGLPMFEVIWADREFRFRSITPLGKVLQEFRVERPGPSESQHHMPRLKPIIIATEEEERAYLREIERVLQVMPERMIRPILEGRGELEPPLTLVVSESEELPHIGLSKPGPLADGFYSNSENLVWVTRTKDLNSFRRILFHEIGGHAVIDSLNPDNERTDVIRTPGAVKEYFIWKLAQIFSPQEFREYDKLDHRYRDVLNSSNSTQAEIDAAEDALRLYRKKIEGVFLDAYAAEGKQVLQNLESPTEYFAVAAGTFFDCLNGTDHWGPAREKEPLLKLLGLDYLFYRYGVGQIGGVAREEVFSDETFAKVLKLNVDRDQRKKMFESDLARRGFTVAVRGGWGWSTYEQASGRITGNEIWVGVYPGYNWSQFSLGVLAEAWRLPQRPMQSTTAPGLQDLGFWGRGVREHGSWTLFFEPALGPRYFSDDMEGHWTFWVGGNGGIGLLHGGVSCVVEGRLGFDRSLNLGVGLSFDPSQLIRTSTVW